MSKLPETCQLRGYSCTTQSELSGPLSPPYFLFHLLRPLGSFTWDLFSYMWPCSPFRNKAHIPNPEPPSHLPPHTIPLGHPSAPEEILNLKDHQFSSVAQSCQTLCYPMNCRTAGLPVHHQLPEFTQTHVHQVGDAIQPSQPLLSPFPPASGVNQVDPSQNCGSFPFSRQEITVFDWDLACHSELGENLNLWSGSEQVLIVQVRGYHLVIPRVDRPGLNSLLK